MLRKLLRRGMVLALNWPSIFLRRFTQKNVTPAEKNLHLYLHRPSNRYLPGKCRIIKILSPLYLMNGRFRFPGCFCRFQAAWAEIIPVEPDQGNACAGKVVHLYSSTFRLSSIPSNQFVTGLRVLGIGYGSFSMFII